MKCAQETWRNRQSQSLSCCCCKKSEDIVEWPWTKTIPKFFSQCDGRSGRCTQSSCEFREHKGIAPQTSLARISHKSKIKDCSATKSTQKTWRSGQPRNLKKFYQNRFQNPSLKCGGGLGAKVHTQTLHIYRKLVHLVVILILGALIIGGRLATNENHPTLAPHTSSVCLVHCQSQRGAATKRGSTRRATQACHPSKQSPANLPQ